MTTRTYKLARNPYGLHKTADFNWQRAAVYGIIAALLAKLFGGKGWTMAGLGAAGAAGGGLQLLPGLAQIFGINNKVTDGPVSRPATSKTGQPSAAAQQLFRNPSQARMYEKQLQLQRQKQKVAQTNKELSKGWQRLQKGKVVDTRDRQRFMMSDDPAQRQRIFNRYQGQGVFPGLWNDVKRFAGNTLRLGADKVYDYTHPDDVTTVYKGVGK